MMRPLGQLACGVALFVVSLLVYADFRGLVPRYERFADRRMKMRTHAKFYYRLATPVTMCIAGIVIIHAVHDLVRQV